MHFFLWLLLLLAPLAGAEKSTICLNMIVKDEKDVIERCLQSVKPMIDHWVIVDTGSTDGTQDIIKKCMEGIPGELYERPWKNFEHNRNEALDLAKGKGDYFLIMDADDRLEYDPTFKLPELNAGAYRFWIRFGSMSYQRDQLISAKLPWKWVGVLHEVLTCGKPYDPPTLEGVRYVVSCEGTRSKDPKKFLKDAQVLETALKEEPNNARYTFYLAQSYRDAGEQEKSLEWYHKRIAMGGWPEEVFLSMVNAAHLERSLGKPIDTVIDSYSKAFRFRPHRAEPVYYLAEIFRSQGRHDLTYALIRSREFVQMPQQKDRLFVQDWIEEYGLLFELSICSYYVGRYEESLEACDRLLSVPTLPQAWKDQTIRNREFSEKRLALKNAA